MFINSAFVSLLFASGGVVVGGWLGTTSYSVWSTCCGIGVVDSLLVLPVASSVCLACKLFLPFKFVVSRYVFYRLSLDRWGEILFVISHWAVCSLSFLLHVFNISVASFVLFVLCFVSFVSFSTRIVA